MIVLEILHGVYTICQLNTDQIIPEEVFLNEFYSVTKTNEELSIIASEPLSFTPARSNQGWKGFKVDGILDFEMTGIINGITKPLKDNNISVFVTSTYNTDYIFVKVESFEKTIEIFKSASDISIKSL